MRKLWRRDVRREALLALEKGAAPHPDRPTTLEWDVSGNCTDPRYVERWGRPLVGAPRKVKVTTMEEFNEVLHLDRLDASPIAIDMTVRCRQCPACLKARARLWAARAKSELAVSPRTWFGTFTLAPWAHSQIAMRARVRLGETGSDFEVLSDEEQFSERNKEIFRELTLYLKRVRKVSGAKLRYCLVAEAHKSGLPHYHILVHEASAAHVTKAVLKDQWKLGFTKWNLVPDTEQGKAAWYVCKYLAKDARARVRASLGYGGSTLVEPSITTLSQIKPPKGIEN